MPTISYRDLKNIDSSTFRKNLTSEGTLLLTVDNKPIALMINLDEENPQDIVQVVSRFRAQIAVHSIRSRARRQGLNGMSLRDVNMVIKKAREERKS